MFPEQQQPVMQQSQTAHNGTASRGWREALTIRRLSRLQVGALRLTLPNGETARFEGVRAGPEADLVMHSPRMINRLLWSGSSGFAEGYIHGDWDSADLAALLYLLHLNADALESEFSRIQRLHTWMTELRHRLRRNTRRGSRRNIAYHYDLGNDFYAQWLDETWTYSGAVFAGPDEDLATAQRRKYQRLLERIDPEPGDHVLEIGCGWGGFALYAAQTVGCCVTGITLSQEQLRFAREQAEAAGLSDRITFELRDYRDLEEQYDHVVSIEMYEAVGEAYWPAYFKTIFDALKSGGRAAIQAITIDDARFQHYRNNVDFIQEYIFPGGMLASPQVFERAAAAQELSATGHTFHGRDYLRTLLHWDEQVTVARSRIITMQGESFYRMWRYYLAYCQAGFRSGNIDLMHVTLTRA